MSKASQEKTTEGFIKFFSGSANVITITSRWLNIPFFRLKWESHHFQMIPSFLISVRTFPFDRHHVSGMSARHCLFFLDSTSFILHLTCFGIKSWSYANIQIKVNWLAYFLPNFFSLGLLKQYLNFSGGKLPRETGGIQSWKILRPEVGCFGNWISILKQHFWKVMCWEVYYVKCVLPTRLIEERLPGSLWILLGIWMVPDVLPNRHLSKVISNVERDIFKRKSCLALQILKTCCLLLVLGSYFYPVDISRK